MHENEDDVDMNFHPPNLGITLAFMRDRASRILGPTGAPGHVEFKATLTAFDPLHIPLFYDMGYGPLVPRLRAAIEALTDSSLARKHLEVEEIQEILDLIFAFLSRELPLIRTVSYRSAVAALTNACSYVSFLLAILMDAHLHTLQFLQTRLQVESWDKLPPKLG